MKNRIITEECVSLYKVIPSVGNIWGVSRLQPDYIYSQCSVFTTWLESTDSHQECTADSACCHCNCARCAAMGWLCCHCSDAQMFACMTATSAGVTPRRERCHYKPDCPDITYHILRHVHLCNMISNFCCFCWEITLTYRLWKPCPCLVDF